LNSYVSTLVAAAIVAGASMLVPMHQADARKGGGRDGMRAGPQVGIPAYRGGGSGPRFGDKGPTTGTSKAGSNRVKRDHRGEPPKRPPPQNSARPCRHHWNQGGYCDRY